MLTDLAIYIGFRLIFAGVIGGLLSFGLIGIFVGPVALAVTYTLVQAWMSESIANNADS